MQINKGIITSANINIRQALIPIANKNARPQRPMIAEYITIHNTANSGATAKQNSDYVVSQNGYISWHFTVGNNEVYQQLPINETGYHCGDGEDGIGNTKSIGIEVAEVYGTDKTIVKFVAELIKATGISIDKVVPHKHWSDKNCPRLILPHWDLFINDIKKELDEVEVMKVDYKKYTANIHELKGNPLDIGVKIVNQKNNTIEEENCVNGTFFWTTDKANVKYATSILYADGKLYQANANHLPYAQSVFIIYKNGTVDMKRIKKHIRVRFNKYQGCYWWFRVKKYFR